VAVTGNNNINAWSGGMEFDGVISGSGQLNWYGAGSLTLNGANTYSGGTTISGANGGTVYVGNASGLGTGPVVNNGNLV